MSKETIEMARKKSGLKPETLDDGGLFGDIELVYEEAKENAKTSNVSNTPKDVSVTKRRLKGLRPSAQTRLRLQKPMRVM